MVRPRNNLSGIIPNFQNLPLLEVLDVSVNQPLQFLIFKSDIKLNTLFAIKFTTSNFPKLLACADLTK
jgi:hypothetical protein